MTQQQVIIGRRHFMKLVLVFCVLIEFCNGHSKIRIADVKSIVLNKGQHTTGRRSSPVPQLVCVGGSGGCGFEPDVVLCENMGSDGRDVTWKCQADLPSHLRLGRVTVSCEGYDYPDDPYILAGSCGLEYRIERSHGTRGGGGNSRYSRNHPYHYEDDSSMLGTLLFYGLVFGAIYVCCYGCGGRRGGGGGGGDGGGEGYDGPGYRPPSQNPGYGRNNQYSQPPPAAAAPAQGGFWSGMGAGGLMGYMLGRNQGYGYGGGYGRHRHHSPFGGGWGASSGGWSSGGGGSGSGTHSSTSFGGTRRR